MKSEELPYHFCGALADIGFSVGMEEYELPPPDEPVLVYYRITNTARLRLRMASPGGKQEEWYTHANNLYPLHVDKVKKELLKLGYDLKVTT